MIFSKYRNTTSYNLLFVSLMLAMVITAVYWRILGHDFVLWDDNIHVFNNAYLQPFTLQSFSHFWHTPFHALYIPIAYIAFGLLSFLARNPATANRCGEFSCGLNPHVFHAASLICHVVNSILVFLIIRRAVKSDSAAGFGALLFAIHPLQVESVAWISELRGLISCVFGLSAVQLYQTVNREKISFGVQDIAAILLFALSILSKPSTVTIPVVLLIWDILLLRCEFRKACARLAPWFILSLADVFITRLVQPTGQVASIGLIDRILVAGDSLGFYIEKLLWPVGLITDYGRTPQIVISGDYYVASIAVVVAFASAIAFFGGKRRWVYLGAIMFVVLLLPVLGLVPFKYQHYSTVADRYVYLAMVGPALALAFGLQELSSRKNIVFIKAAAVSALCLLAYCSSAQTNVWRNTHTLFETVLRYNREDWLSHYQIGDDDLIHNHSVAAEAELRKVVALGHGDGFVLVDLAQSLHKQKRFRDAAFYYTQALALQPDLSTALVGRAQCEALIGQPDRSIVDFQAALRLNPNLKNAHYELGLELGVASRYREAANEFNLQIASDRNYLPAYYFLAVTYGKIGNSQLAADAARMALAVDPNDSAVLPFLKSQSVRGVSTRQVSPRRVYL
jgi:tetratricopeptide (TPR) repeat protein